MKNDRPSRTAHLVALGRALADLGLSHVPNFHDPTARFFLNDKGKESLAKVEQGARAERPGFRVQAARGMADMIALRTAPLTQEYARRLPPVRRSWSFWVQAMTDEPGACPSLRA
jgi:O-methyltransferase involved in polyketide biosynthesis